MKLVSAEEAKVILGFMEMGGLDGSTPSQEKYRLAATVEALWPIVKKAAREPCDCGKGYECPTLETITLSDWCSRCQARLMVAERKERRE